MRENIMSRPGAQELDRTHVVCPFPGIRARGHGDSLSYRMLSSEQRGVSLKVKDNSIFQYS